MSFCFTLFPMRWPSNWTFSSHVSSPFSVRSLSHSSTGLYPPFFFAVGAMSLLPYVWYGLLPGLSPSTPSLGSPGTSERPQYSALSLQVFLLCCATNNSKDFGSLAASRRASRYSSSYWFECSEVRCRIGAAVETVKAPTCNIPVRDKTVRKTCRWFIALLEITLWFCVVLGRALTQ